jgi:hypothetical protein
VSGRASQALTLKIALGVFLGIVAVLVLVSVPGWIEQSNKNHARIVSGTMTPEKLIARCGQPIKDNTVSLYGTISIRDMQYQASHKNIAILSFTGEHANDSHLTAFHLGADIGNNALLPEENDPQEQLIALPCMDK